MISTNVAGTYLVSFYGATAVLVYKIALLKSTDSGATWALGATIYSGATQYNESTIAHIGAGKIVCLSRVEAGGVLVQMASADNGETWGAPANSNLGTAGATVSIPFMIYDSDLGILVCAYLDRAAGYRYKVSWGDALTIYGDPTTWGVSVPIDSNTVNEKNGYISFVKLTGQYFIVYSKEKDAGDADIWGGTFSVPKSKWQRRPSGLWGLAHNGADSVVDFGDVCDAQNYLTLKTWIDVDQSAMNNRVGHIISKSDGGSTNKGYYLSFDDRDSVPRVNCIVFTVYQEVGVYISGGVALATGRHHIVAVFNKDLVGTAKVAIYVDKVAQALSYLTGGALATIGTNALPLRIGASSATPAASYCKFKHWLDVVIPEVAWTQAQVTDSYDKELWMPAS